MPNMSTKTSLDIQAPADFQHKGQVNSSKGFIQVDLASQASHYASQAKFLEFISEINPGSAHYNISLDGHASALLNIHIGVYNA